MSDDKFSTEESAALLRAMWPEWPGARGAKPAPDLGEFLRSYRAGKVETMAKYVRADEMAALLSITVERLSLLVAQGCPQNGRDKYNPDEVIHWFLAHTRQTIFENAKRIGLTLR